MLSSYPFLLPSRTVRPGKFTPTHFYSAPGGTLEVPSVVDTAKFAREVRHRESEKGSHILEGLRIFKTGTFRDMFGTEHTWDDFHLTQMVMHYQLLSDGGYFADVPVRQDHTFSVKDVVGYFQSIYHDPEDRQFLTSDIEFTEPDAYGKWFRGTWRARSIEIGMYETGDGKSFWPVVMGLAFVDIPAVEGLYRGGQKPPAGYSQQVITDKEEGSMQVPDITKDPEGWTKAVNYAAWLQAASYAQALVDWERAVVYAAALEQEHPGTPVVPFAAPPATPSAPTPDPSPPTSPSPPIAQFRINGQATTDFRAVQVHIDTLEQTIAAQVKMGREEFVQQLAHDNKIGASQIEGLTAHALSLTPEQFSSFRATYDAAPPSSLFGQHGQQSGESSTPSGSPTDDLDVAKGVVAQFRSAGLSEEKVKQSPSYKKLVAAGIEKA